MRTFVLKLPLALLAMVGLLQLNACQPDDPNPYENLDLITSAESGLVSIELYADEVLYSGFNTLYVKVMNDGKETKTANVTLKPIMDMGTFSHSCPVEQPALNSNDIFEGKALFQMPSEGGTWELNVTVNLIDDNSTYEFALPIDVIQPEYTRVLVTQSEIDAQKLIIGYINPISPKVGDNDFEVAIFTMQDMMNFPAVEGLKVKIVPEMPSMGHGSEGNVNPTDIGNGHYKGNVAFNMVGDWKINMTILNGDAVVKDGLYFDLYFQ